MSDDDGPMQKFKDGINHFISYFREQRWSEICVRIMIFVGLSVLVHGLYVWILYSVVIPILQSYVVDALMDETKKRLEFVEYGNFKLSKLTDL